VKKHSSSTVSLGLIASGLILSTVASVHADVVVTNSATAPVTSADDQSYLPGNVDETATMTVDGTNNNSGENDLLTYVANDRSSKGMSFTTGPHAQGYALGSITVQHIGWNVFTTNGTFFTIAPGNTFDIRIGTISGNTLTPLYTTIGTYSGARIPTTGNGANSGTGSYFTFDLSGAAEQAGIGTLAPNTTYFFEIASGTGNPFLELNNTAANGYAGGFAFRGDNTSVVDADGTVTAPPNGGDFAFHADLTPLSAAPVFATQPQNTQGEVGGMITLTSLAPSNPAPTYQWQKSANGTSNWTNIPDATSSTLQISSAAYADNGFYHVIATVGSESVTSETAQITIIYPDPQIFSQPASVAVEAGGAATLQVGAGGVGSLSYQWFKDLEPIVGAISETLELTDLEIADAGSYTVEVTDNAALADSLPPTTTTSAAAIVTVFAPWDGLVSEDPFSIAAGYVAGTLHLQNPTVSGYAGAWTGIDGGTGRPEVTSGSLTYPNPNYLGSSGDKVSDTALDQDGRVYRVLEPRLVVGNSTAGTRYLSWLQQFDNDGNAIYSTLALYNTDTANGNRNFDAGVSTNDFGGSTNFRFRAKNSYGVYGGDLAVAPAAGQVHLMVAKFVLSTDGGADSITMWIDPVLGGAGDPAGGVTVTGFDLQYDRLVLSDYTSSTAAFDEVRWGSSFNSVTLNPNPPANFAAWIAGFNVGSLNGFNDDADGDGIKNGLENVFGTNPSVANQGVTAVAKTGSTITFRHPQSGSPASDVTAAYKWSTDLATFHASGAASGGTTVTLTPALNTPSAGTTTVTATITGTQPAKLFLTLEATQP
jgi:hypothetical protein